jgi:nicotinamidase-related amidase
VVIDMQVDFASPDGVLGKAGLDMSPAQPALAAAVKLVDAARAANVPVVFVGLQTTPETDSPAWRERMRRRGGDPNAESAVCREGARGAAFVGPRPRPGEPLVAKTRYSGFYETDLNAVLASLGADTLVVCGLTTECCVDCTVRDAFHLDYHVFIPVDACAAYDPALHEAALASLELNCAILTTTDAVATAWMGVGSDG